MGWKDNTLKSQRGPEEDDRLSGPVFSMVQCNLCHFLSILWFFKKRGN